MCEREREREREIEGEGRETIEMMDGWVDALLHLTARTQPERARERDMREGTNTRVAMPPTTITRRRDHRHNPPPAALTASRTAWHASWKLMDT